jgi:trehalose-phosphatase
MTLHALAAWPALSRRLRGRPILLFLDYDGTLAPIASRPGLAVLPLERRRFLSALAEEPWLKGAVVSGRELKDVKRRVGARGFVYVGNHGLEIEKGREVWVHPAAALARARLRGAARKLRRLLGAVPGVSVEDKGFTLTVHYRLASAARLPEIEARLLKAIAPDLAAGKFSVRPGRKAWEVRPVVDWNKGSAVRWLLDGPFARVRGGLPVYIGDDATDEDAFRVLRRRGLCVKRRSLETAGRPTAAQAHLDSVDEVFEFLRRLRDLRAERAARAV